MANIQTGYRLMRTLEVAPLMPAEAELIASWRYEGAYAFYNGPDGGESESVRYMVDPRNGFHAVRGPSGLLGFCSFGTDARVPGGTYEDDALDIGAGMDPALVGGGLGQAFLQAVVAHATLKLNARRLRATIASWNDRALRAAQSAGFRPTSTFRSNRAVEFTILIRETSGAIG